MKALAEEKRTILAQKQQMTTQLKHLQMKEIRLTRELDNDKLKVVAKTKDQLSARYGAGVFAFVGYVDDTWQSEKLMHFLHLFLFLCFFRLLCSFMFFSVLLCSSLFFSVLLCSSLFYSVLSLFFLCSSLFFSVSAKNNNLFG
jgi:hypothetical protein